MKKILILGAGRGQVGLIQSAKKEGYRTIVASIPGNYPGFALADEIEYVDILDEEKVLEAARRNEVSGVASCCIDLPMKAQGYVCEKLGFKGITSRAAELSVNKYLMKNALIEGGALTPRYFRVSSEAELDQALEHLKMPVIIKAVDQAGSKGLNVVRQASEASEAFRKSMQYTNLDYCIVEEFIEGCKIGCNACVVDGDILFVLPCGDITVNAGTVIPVGHYMPLELDSGVADEVHRQMELGIRALGLDNCAVNADLMIRDDEVYIIELTGRQGANCLAEMISVYYGTDMYGLIAKLAMGDVNADEYSCFRNGPFRACLAEMLISDKGGIIKALPDTECLPDGVEEVTFFSEPGDKVNAFANTSDCIGQVVVSGQSLDECRAVMKQAQNKLKIEVE